MTQYLYMCSSLNMTDIQTVVGKARCREAEHEN
jgi:hypothetical protein